MRAKKGKNMSSRKSISKFKKIAVGIAPDAIERIAKVAPDKAIEELIWNAIDAEATRIDVVFQLNAIDGIEKITVSDNGHGISEKDAEEIFSKVGGSPKRNRRRSPNLDRPYHGKEGQGRYKALSLGRKLSWISRTLSNEKMWSLIVQLDGTALRSAEIGIPTECDGTPGCDVYISDLNDAVSALRNPNKIDALISRLAPYLMANPSIGIYYDGSALDVSMSLNRDEMITVDAPAVDSSNPIDLKLRVLEWKTDRKPTLFLCDADGVALDEIPLELKRGRLSFTAYLLSDHIRELNDQRRLALDNLDEELIKIKQATIDVLQGYLRRRREEEARTYADHIRREGIYPYAHQPQSPVEKAEQQVFDICAATIHEFLPLFENADKGSRRFAYRILREALESNPTNVGMIFTEVLKLTDEQQEDLVHLLGPTSLGAVIHTAKTVNDRLCFINGLEQILHDKDKRKHLKERSQLHRILVEELWIFGDEYTLGSDDVSLKSVLSEHRSVLEVSYLDAQLPKAGITDLDDIPDLFLWRRYLRGRRDEFEHLVIELKRPTVKISLEEISQVKKYATKVMNNRYFDKDRTRWTFIALSDGIAQDAEEDVNQRDRQPGHVVSGKFHDVWVWDWSQVIQSAKIRLNWLQESLNLAVSDNSEGMRYLQSRFGYLLPSQLVDINSSPANEKGITYDSAACPF
jgi:hypothetical protein